MVVLTKQEHIHLKWAVHYWKAQYERVAEREAALKQEVAAQQAQIRDLSQRLYGKKSEKGAGKKPVQAAQYEATRAAARQCRPRPDCAASVAGGHRSA